MKKNIVLILLAIILLFATIGWFKSCNKEPEIIITTDTIIKIRSGEFEKLYNELQVSFDSVSDKNTTTIIKYIRATDSVFLIDTVFKHSYLKSYNDTIINKDGKFYTSHLVLGDLMSFNLLYDIETKEIITTVTKPYFKPYKYTIGIGYELHLQEPYINLAYNHKRMNIGMFKGRYISGFQLGYNFGK